MMPAQPLAPADRDSLKVARLSWFARLIGKAMALGYQTRGQGSIRRFSTREDLMACALSSCRACSIRKCLAPANSWLRRSIRSLVDAATRKFWIWVRDPASARFSRPNTRVASWQSTSIPAAVRCAGINALLNHRGAQDRCAAWRPVRTRAGRAFRSNPIQPAFRARRDPRDDRDRAWRSNDVAARFAAGLGTHLKPGGRAGAAVDLRGRH